MTELDMKNCPNEQVVLDYTAGCLDPIEALRFERHTGECAHCRALVTAQTAVWRSLDEWTPAPVSADFNRELWRRIDADATPSSWAGRLAAAMHWSLWKRAVPLALALALVVTGYVYDHAARHTGQPPAGATASIVLTVDDANQLERALDDIQLLHAADAAAAPAKTNSVM